MLILDTGPVLAILNAADAWNPRCVAMMKTEPRPWLLPGPVLVELDYFLRERLPSAARHAFYSDIRAEKYQLETLSPADFNRAFEICAQYQGIGLQLADASVIALSERLGETRVATTDRRDFRQVVPRHCPALTLLPEGPDKP